MNNSNKANTSRVSVYESYGPLKVGCLYTIVKEGRDFYELRCCGTNVQTPKIIVDLSPKTYENTISKDDGVIDGESGGYLEDYLDEYFTDGV
jgi:hypothetical protein